MGVLIVNCVFAAEADKEKRIDRFSESENFYDGKFHNHNDVKLASPSFWRATKAVMFEGTDKVPTRPLPVTRLNRNDFQKDRFGNFSFVWLGNASVLINLENKYLLTDNVVIVIVTNMKEIKKDIEYLGNVSYKNYKDQLLLKLDI